MRIDLVPADHRRELQEIRTFPSLIRYLRDEMGWPISTDDFEDLTFDYTPEELGIDPKIAAKIDVIKRLRPLSIHQPWGIFFVKFEPKRLPVVALRRILSQVAIKKRSSANNAERTAWAAADLLFISNYGEGDTRQISFAHFSESDNKQDLPTLKVLGWDNLDTPLHIDDVHESLTRDLAWPVNEADVDSWRATWSSAFTLRNREVIRTSRELSVRLAMLARGIRDRILTALSVETSAGALTKLMSAFREALIHDLDANGFADMYAQTIAYGLLSARIANPRGNTADDLHLQMPITNPFLRELMETFLHVGGRHGKSSGPGIDFDELGINDVVELLDDANMEAVVRDFGDRNPQEDPVIHFYELFLKEYDSKKRMQRGVFYTPRPVVSYILRSVDHLLRTELGLEDGLADTATWSDMAQRLAGLKIPDDVDPSSPFVQVLDPAVGTGTFLVEAIDMIYGHMTRKWISEGWDVAKRAALWNKYVPDHLLPRLHGYELLMAPYAIAHLKLGLKLYETGYLFGSDERARIFLTNALEPAHDFSGQFAFTIPALAHEAEAVNDLKAHHRYTVVVGNPPYSLMSANLEPAARHLVDAYRFVDGVKIRERGALQLEKNLQDDYVKFVRLGQTICDAVPVAILSYVTNHAYLDNPTLRGLRSSLLESFDHVSVFDLHGNTKRKEACPLPEGDENVFDIQQGVAIGLFAKTLNSSAPVRDWDELWGLRTKKYSELQSGDGDDHSRQSFTSTPPLYLFIVRDEVLQGEFERGWPIDGMFDLYSTGIATARDRLTVHMSKEGLDSVLEELLLLEPEEARERYSLGPDTNDWKVSLAQADLRNSQPPLGRTERYLYRPFDRRWTFYTGHPRGFHCNPRRPVMENLLAGPNVALCTVKGIETGHAYAHVFVSSGLADHHCVSLKEVNYIFPLFVYDSADEMALNDGVDRRRPNFSIDFCNAIDRSLGVSVGNDNAGERISPEAILGYVYGILFAPTYRDRYQSLLRKQFARIPMPPNDEFFRKLSRSGSQLMSLHLMDSSAAEIPFIECSGSRNPLVERIGWSDDTVWLNAPKSNARSQSAEGRNGIRGVSESMWNFHVGGYRVCEKWLKDRKGLTLSDDDLTQYGRILHAINESSRLMQEIDEVIEHEGGWPGAFAQT